MFHSKGTNRGVRTFFNTKQINDSYIGVSSRTYSYTSQLALYDFNRKVKYIWENFSLYVSSMSLKIYQFLDST